MICSNYQHRHHCESVFGVIIIICILFDHRLQWDYHLYMMQSDSTNINPQSCIASECNTIKYMMQSFSNKATDEKIRQFWELDPDGSSKLTEAKIGSSPASNQIEPGWPRNR